MNSIIMQPPKTVEILGGVEYLTSDFVLSVIIKPYKYGSSGTIDLVSTLNVPYENIRGIQWVKGTTDTSYVPLNPNACYIYYYYSNRDYTGTLRWQIATAQQNTSERHYTMTIRVMYIKGTAPTGIGDYGTFYLTSETELVINKFGESEENFYKYFTVI